MDQIKIENLEIFANHGVYPEENRLGPVSYTHLTLPTT